MHSTTVVAFLSPSPQFAKKYHPDRNKGDANTAKQFTKIGEAYEVITNYYVMSFIINPFVTAGVE